MVREVMSEAVPQRTTAQAQETQPTPLAAEPPSDSRRDALAEAFPAWDLLPAVAFVRRVK